MIPATEADRPAIEVFLQGHLATSMFPLSNLREYGMAGGHGRAMRFWLRWRAGVITDAVGLSDAGFLFPQCPTAPWADVRVTLAGCAVKGLLGDGPQVAALRAVLRLPVLGDMDLEDPLYQLDYADLRMPDVAGFALQPLAAAPRELIVQWRHAYLQEVMPLPGEDMHARAAKDIAGYIKADSHRVLYHGADPVAMTGFNAALPDAVQIGGVYTPLALRGRGYARRAVALHLAEVARPQAFLSAANTKAARAYEAVGFTCTGTFTILMYEHPQVIHV